MNNLYVIEDLLVTYEHLPHCLWVQDIVSEHPERFFVAEIVREKIFMQYRNEVPYACQVYD